jgi:hypothetical protein
MAFMARHNLSHSEVDLIVDLGPVDHLIREGIEALAAAFLAEVPEKTRWRTLTISGCAFPMSMGGVGRGSYSYVERAEWLVWRDYLFSNRQNLERLPTYSDCGIQHPSGVEGFDPRLMQVSAAIRYGLEEAWLLIKGESTRMTPPSVQFPGLATQLVYGRFRNEFAGSNHCQGCKGMKAAADQEPRFGSAEIWRKLGTIHHITTVVNALSDLP